MILEMNEVSLRIFLSMKASQSISLEKVPLEITL